MKSSRQNDVRVIVLLLSWTMFAASCSAQPAAAPKAPDGTPVSSPADDASTPAADAIAVTNVAELRGRVGKAVTVHGRVSRTGKSRSGINFLNFAGTELTIVCRAENVAKFEGGAPADTFDGVDVEVTGTLERYKGKLQITIAGPDQIRKLEAELPGGDANAAIELKRLGDDHWLSPARLHYKGRDPAGLTRLQHVLRHSEDDPDRDGPHGVFDGGRDGALATIDEAWTITRKRGTRPRTDGGRSAYLVRMPRNVGYLGGSVGRQRQNPKLQSVLLVVEEGTSNLVTAYPK